MTEEMTMELADYRARCFVNGVRRHEATGKLEPISGEFHERFLSHPWVRESITEGWAMELRQHLTMAARLKIARKQPIGEIEGLMPPRDWVNAAKVNTDRYRAAKQWRDETFGPGDGEALLRRLIKTRTAA